MGTRDLITSKTVSSLVSLLVPRYPSRVLQKPPTQNLQKAQMSSKESLFCLAKGPEMCDLRAKILSGNPRPNPIKHQQKYCTNRCKVFIGLNRELIYPTPSLPGRIRQQLSNSPLQWCGWGQAGDITPIISPTWPKQAAFQFPDQVVSAD